MCSPRRRALPQRAGPAGTHQSRQSHWSIPDDRRRRRRRVHQSAFGNYEIEVSALGYLTARQEVQTVSTIHPQPIDIVLQRDPSAINLDVTPGIISPKARKEVQHAVSLLKAGDFAEAQKHLGRPTNWLRPMRTLIFCSVICTSSGKTTRRREPT